MCISLTVLCLYAEISKNNGDHDNRYRLSISILTGITYKLNNLRLTSFLIGC